MRRVLSNVRSVVVTTPPSVEPISLVEAKLHLRVDGADEDDLIGLFITAARSHVEDVTGAALMQQTWQVTWDRFEERMTFPGGRVSALSSLTYLDLQGDLQAMQLGVDYVADLASVPARVAPPAGKCWPRTLCVPAAVTAAIRVGLPPATGDAPGTQIPAALRAVLLMIIGDLYTNREATGQANDVATNPTIERLLAPFTVMAS
jgi:uncharacterized phiE125 gp8 family phage protein